MDDELAQQAASVIEDLLKSAADDSYDVPFTRAMAVRDDLREVASDGLQPFDEGDIVVDQDPPHWSDDDRVEVLEVTDTPANEWHINPFETVASENPDYPEDDNVVRGRYASQSGDQVYAFPESRLDRQT